MNKKNKQTKVNGGFNIQPKRNGGFVSYTQPYNGGMIYAVARVQEGDVFDEERGKAVAFAKTELLIRKCEERKALHVLDEMQCALRRELKKDPSADASRMWSKHISAAADYHKELLRYLRNQKRIVELVSEHYDSLGFMLTYTQALKAAHDQALAEEKARLEEDEKKKVSRRVTKAILDGDDGTAQNA